MRTTNKASGLMRAMCRLGAGLTQLTWLVGMLLIAAGLSSAWAGVTVTLTAPANGASFTAPANITLTATASATQGYKVSKVEFFHGATLIGPDTKSPYSFNWSNVPAGSYTVTAKATAVKKNQPNQTATSAPVTITVSAPNAPPTVSMTSPANGATFTAPANITLTATAADSDGTIQKVEFFHGGTNLIATLTAPPYSIIWTGVPQGAYTLTAVATDNLNVSTASSPVSVTVGAAAAQLYFIYTDHLNTPRLITNGAGQAVWRWDNTDPFGNNVPNENPSGLGNFTCNLRLPGQYFDQETNLHYNYFRDYDPAIGRYVQSDPIGLEGGINTYAYVNSNPLSFSDPEGLMRFGGGGSAGSVRQPAECPPTDCPDPITITPNSVCKEGDDLCAQAMQAAGLQPHYFPKTTTYSAVCLLKFGIGFTGGKMVVGTVAINQAPNLATRLGLSAANVARVGRVASALNSPPAFLVGGSMALVGILKQCECSSK